MKRIFICFTLILFAFSLSVPAVGDEIGYDIVPVKVGGEYEILCGVWYPAEEGGEKAVYDFGNTTMEGSAIRNATPKVESGPLPVIIYSHGYSGCSISSIYLTESLAVSGYIVVAPDHTDNLKACSLMEDFVRERGYALKLLKKATRLSREFSRGDYDPQFFKYRYSELSAAIDWIISEGSNPGSPFYSLVDTEKIGAVGHSLGGYSVLAASGIDDAARDPRISSVVSLSGPGERVFSCNDMKGVKIPTMLMYGGREKRKEEGIGFQFRCLSPPKFILVISGADHLTFSETAMKSRDRAAERKRHEIIDRYVTTFFDYFIKGDERGKEILKGPAVGLDRYDFSF